MSQVEFRDIVNIDHPIAKGTGLVNGFRNDSENHVIVEAIDVVMVATGEPVKPGRVMNVKCANLTVVEKFDWDNEPEFVVEDDTLMQELFDSEDERDAAIPVVDQHIGFVGNWKSK